MSQQLDTPKITRDEANKVIKAGTQEYFDNVAKSKGTPDRVVKKVIAVRVHSTTQEAK